MRREKPRFNSIKKGTCFVQNHNFRNTLRNKMADKINGITKTKMADEMINFLR